MMRCLLLILAFGISSIPSRSAENKYFQQKTDYRISVRLDDIGHILHGQINITYHNQSPDTLTFIMMHLWPNAYRDQQSALAGQLRMNGKLNLYNSTIDERGYIDSLNFSCNGRGLTLIFDKTNPDIAKLDLTTPLLPGESVEFNSPFRVKIPSAFFSRLGHIGQAYAITQWYPKPAVYDRDGWQAMPYLDQGEFYSEFGSFEVAITLPSNYVVGATGDLVDNPAEIDFLNRKSEEPLRKGKDEQAMRFPESATTLKTLTYRQDSIHDFAWFADKRYQVRKGLARLESGKEITTWALFTPYEASLWENATRYLEASLQFYSNEVGDYPYSQCTAVDGTISAGGGMEYPMITIIGSSYDSITFEITLAHEVGHNWFYGILGTNERKHAWMDEGINSFYEMEYMLNRYPTEKYGNISELSGLGKIGTFCGLDNYNYAEVNLLMYSFSALSRNDQPMEGPLSPDFSEGNYGTIVYKKSAVVFNYLQAYLGEEKFRECMKEYFRVWRFSHPGPDDLKRIFSEKSGKDLAWFFDGAPVKSNRQLDYAVINAVPEDDKVYFKLKNRGEYSAPVPVASMKDGQIQELKWFEPAPGIRNQLKCSDCDEVRIDPNYETPDLYRTNNQCRTSGLFPALEKLHLQTGPHFNKPEHSRISLYPALAWNNYNGLMAGIAVSNVFAPEKRFEYALAPMFGFGDNSLAGTGELITNFYHRTGALRKTSLGLRMRRFALDDIGYTSEGGLEHAENRHYEKLEPYLAFHFRPTDYNSRKSNFAEISYSQIWRDELKFYESSPGSYSGYREDNDFGVLRLRYNYANKRSLDPFSLTVYNEWMIGQSYQNDKGNYFRSSLIFNYLINYKNRNRGIHIRTFIGGVWYDDQPGAYSFVLSDRNGSSGDNDYFYDSFYFGRNETEDLLFQQFNEREGGFKVYQPLGNQADWLVTMCIKADFPKKLPFQAYAEIGTYSDIKEINEILNASGSFTMNAGLVFTLAQGIFEVYFPLLLSKDITQFNELNNRDSFGERIRFVFDIRKMNPINLRNSISLL